MRDHRNIFNFIINKRKDGTKVVLMLIPLEDGGEYCIGFLTDYQIDELIKLRKHL